MTEPARDPVYKPLLRGLALLGVSVPWSVVALGAAAARRPDAFTGIARRWAQQLLDACGVEVECVMPDVPLDAPAYLVMSNHTSHFDVISIYATVDIDMRPVAKQELAVIPLFGWVLRTGAAILIDRKDPQRARESIQEAARTIRAGRSVLMFPEGTRTPTEELGTLKKGAFHLAQAARVPVVPVAVLGTHAILPADGWAIRPGKVQVRVGRPIPTDSLPDGEAGRDQLMEAFRGAISELVREGNASRLQA